jgi:hypothetical protein
VMEGSRGDELQRSRISPFSLSCRRYRTAKVKTVAQQDLLALHKVRAQLFGATNFRGPTRGCSKVEKLGTSFEFGERRRRVASMFALTMALTSLLV